MPNVFRALTLALNDRWLPKNLQRTPEPDLVMNNDEQCYAFHQAGNKELLPIYHFNAMCMSSLVPQNGRVLDLGSGSAQFLSYLSRCRPDLQITGVDLSENMIAIGKKHLSEQKQLTNVQLIAGDMCDLTPFMNQKFDLVSSVFSLHHLPDTPHLEKCLTAMTELMKKSSAAIWIFDHARPRRRETAEGFPEIFTPHAHQQLKLDSSNSLKAAWQIEDIAVPLKRQLKDSPKYFLQSELSRILPFYQIHWATLASEHKPEHPKIKCAESNEHVLRESRSFARLFAHLPT